MCYCVDEWPATSNFHLVMALQVVGNSESPHHDSSRVGIGSGSFVVSWSPPSMTVSWTSIPEEINHGYSDGGILSEAEERRNS